MECCIDSGPIPFSDRRLESKLWVIPYVPDAIMHARAIQLRDFALGTAEGWNDNDCEPFTVSAGESNRSAVRRPRGTEIIAIVYRRLVAGLGHAQAVGAIADRLCRLIWKILHEGIRYEERRPAVSEEAKNVRSRKMIRELRRLGFHVELLSGPSGSPA